MENTSKNNSEKDNTNIKDAAINHKSNEADGKQINHQVEQRREQHQPRDNA